MTQWLGGMGVIALFVAVLPRLAIGGRELFFAEASGLTDEKLTPQLQADRACPVEAVRGADGGTDVGALAGRHEPLRRRAATR